MSLNKIRQVELKPVFDALEEAFNRLSIDFYLIGAIARDIWYAKGNAVSTGTRDVDFAVFIANQEDYNLLKAYLVKQKNFVESKTNAFVFISPEGLVVDILPFGEIEIDDSVHITAEGLTSIRVNGFKEVFETGTERLELETGHAFEVATLPSIVLLKLISYDDRPEQRLKDPGDIASIIQNYFDLQSDNIYENHTDLFDNADFTLQKAGARIIGREIKTIIESNTVLKRRITDILKSHINQADESVFIRNMRTDDNFVLSIAVDWLNEMLKGITE
jgi:predicted nucleotidyltransferase